MPPIKMPTLRRRRRSSAKEDMEKAVSELSLFDRAAKTIYSSIDSGYPDQTALDDKDAKFRAILNRELELAKGVSGGSIVDFVSAMKLDEDKNRMKNGNYPVNGADRNDMFTRNINDIFGYFQEMYRNRFIEMADLKFIAKFIPSLGEAVKTILDSVVSADNIAETVNREIVLPEGIDENDKTAIINEIERIEKELMLLRKLKNTVYKKTLVTGTYYVYAVSYDKIFEEYDMIKKRNKVQINPLGARQFGNFVDKDKVHVGSHTSTAIGRESSYYLGDIDISPAMENIHDLLSSSPLINPTSSKSMHLDSKTIQTTMDEFYQSLPEITFESDGLVQDAYDDMDIVMESDVIRGAVQKALNKKNTTGLNINDTLRMNPLTFKVPDGTVGVDHKPATPSKFNISGTYLKFIDAKNLLPLRIFDAIVGYYHIQPKSRKNQNSAGEVTGINSIGNTLFSAVNIGEQKKHDAIQRIIDTISDGILNRFDKKFVSKHSEYRKLIADVIVANGLVDKNYNIQFIPAEDVIRFTVNETEEGFGESILSDSLFDAKLLLTMTVTRMLNYVNKTGNKTIAHIHQGPVDDHDHNQIQRIIRDIQDQDVTFNDLLSPNLVFNKFNRDGNMVIPTAQNDNRLVEFETQEGQQIDMHPDYEDSLNKNVMLGVGVPSAALDQFENIEYSRQIISSHIKLAGRVATIQGDLEIPTTELYKKLIMNSNLTDEQKTICNQGLEIKLPRPRVLKNANNADYISTVLQTEQSIADTMIGENSVSDTENHPDYQRVKEIMVYKMARRDLAFLEWDEYEKILEDAILQAKEENINKSDDESNALGGGDTGGSSGGGDEDPMANF